MFKRLFWKLSVVALLAGLLPSLASAAPLDLARGLPDLYSTGIIFDYAGSTGAGDFGALTGTGTPQTLANPDGSEQLIWGDDGFRGEYHLRVGIDALGVLDNTVDLGGIGYAGDNLVIRGNLTSPFDPELDLLTAQITLFGDPAEDTLEMVAIVTDGVLASNFGGIGARIGLILNNTGHVGTTWTGSAFGAIDGNADTFVELVPAPSPLLLMMLAALGLMPRLRHKS